MYNRERNTIKIKISIDDWFASRNTERTAMSSVEQMPDLNQEEELKREKMEPQIEVRFLNIWLLKEYFLF